MYVMDVMYSMYFVFFYYICPVYCSIDTNACQYVRIKKLLLCKPSSFKTMRPIMKPDSKNIVDNTPPTILVPICTLV